jgi:HAD superfamily hydrolase (TIGR01509 family)
MVINMKKYILFDNDGVLVETEPLYYRASKRALKEFFDLDLNIDDYMEIMIRGGTAWEKAEAIGIQEAKISKARDKRNIYYQEYLQTQDIAISGVHEILEKLSKNYRMGIVTTSRRVDFELIHKNRGITDYMDFVLCVEDYEFAKPHPQPYLKGLELFKAKKEETIIVEDSKRGLTSANRANIDCAIVFNQFTKTQDFSSATYKIDTLKDLLEIL